MPKPKKAHKESISRTIDSPLTYTSEMEDNYNSLLLEMKVIGILNSSYDDAVAYRFISPGNKPFQIKRGTDRTQFPENFTATVPYVRTGTVATFNLNSLIHLRTTIQPHLYPVSIPTVWLFLPLAIDAGDGIKAVFTETDLRDYPGLYLYNPTGTNQLKGMHAPLPTKS